MEVEFYLKEPLKQNVMFKKIGLYVRKLTKNEKQNIISKFEKTYFDKKVKSKILKYIQLNSHKEVNSLEFLKFYTKLSEQERNDFLLYYEYSKKGKKLSKNELKLNLEKIIKVEIRDDINEFIYENQMVFIENFMKYMVFIKKNSFDNNELFSITNFFNNKHKDTNYTYDITVKYFNRLPNEDGVFFKPININYNDFLEFKDFTEKLDKTRIRDLFVIIENLFNEHNVQENRIISDVSILERLLIKQENNYDIGRQFVLKVGLILRRNLKSFNNDDVKKLRYCYEVRSHILHGNDININDLPEKILKTNKKNWEIYFSALSIKSKREQVMFVAYCYLKEYLPIILQSWLNETEEIEFLKKN